jgi:hypothetical protein
MSRKITIVLILTALVAQNRAIAFGVITNNAPQLHSNKGRVVLKKQPEKLSNSSDTIVLGILGAVDTVIVQAKMDSTDEPVTAQFMLKTSRWGDTLEAFQNAYEAIIPVPFELFMPLDNTPQYPFPHPNAVPFNDSIYPFKIVPSKYDQRLSGITTYDLALISRHVMGLQQFTSKFKMLAADVNKDGTIDGVDILMIRRLIMHVDTIFRQVPHWVFIPKTYKFPLKLPKLDSIPQAYFFNAYALNLPRPFEFSTIKMGDVNNSFHDTTALPISTPTVLNDRSSRRTLALTTENTRLEKGKTYNLALKCNQSEQLIALQGTLSIHTEGASPNRLTVGQSNLKAQFDAVGSVSLGNFGLENWNIFNGQVAFSWNDVANKFFRKNEMLLNITLKANQDGKLSDVLKLNNDLAESIAYTEGSEARKIELVFTEPAKDLEVFQNEPNPFMSETSLKINVSNLNGEATPVKSAIFDENGHLLFQQTQNFSNGSHVLRFNSNETGMSKTGIYFLKVETPEGQQTLKLMKL